MILHELKCSKQYYEAVANGLKTFELRFNDRNFNKGDLVWLREVYTDQMGTVYTNRAVNLRITYILYEYEGLKDGWVILGIVLI